MEQERDYWGQHECSPGGTDALPATRGAQPGSPVGCGTPPTASAWLRPFLAGTLVRGPTARASAEEPSSTLPSWSIPLPSPHARCTCRVCSLHQSGRGPGDGVVQKHKVVSRHSQSTARSTPKTRGLPVPGSGCCLPPALTS